MYTDYDYRVNTGNATTTVAIIEEDGGITTTDVVTEGTYLEQQVVKVTHCGSSGTVYVRIIPETTAKGSLVSSSLFEEALTTSDRSKTLLKPAGSKILILGSATIACSVAVFVEQV